MTVCKRISKMWFLALLLITVVAGCGGNDAVAPNSNKSVTAYSVAGATGTVDESSKTISVTVPYGTNVTSQAATFTTTGSAVKVGAVEQMSAATSNNFTNPVLYTVSATDNSSTTYAVTVTVAQASGKAITSYSLTGVAGVVNETTKTIAVTMPSGTNATALIGTFTTTGKDVKVGTVPQKSAVTSNNFVSPVAYIVTAADNSTVTYTVTVTVAQSSANTINAYSLAGVSGMINATAKTIVVTMPSGTNVTTLIANFTTTGAAVKVGSVTQKSGATSNNFTGPVTYTVTAANGSTSTYIVTVTAAASSAKAITAFKLAGVIGIVKEATKTISVTMPKGTDVTVLIANFTTTGSGVKIGSAVQKSGITSNNFTGSVIYTVTAADSTTQAYTVTVTVPAAGSTGPAPVNLGTAGNFVILAKTGVSTTGTTAVTGNIGLSPAAATFLTGFSLVADPTNVFSTSSYVTGKLYASNYAVPTPANMTTAISNMQTAFTDAAGRTLPDFTELGAGDISGMTLVPGLYKWGTGVLITSGVTLAGGANDVWIFQIGEGLTVSDSAIITLIGGAQAKNIFWQVSGQATLGTAADFKGIILSQTLISLNTGTKMTGRALAQTAVTLDATAITAP